MSEHINVDVKILNIKESKETVKLGETRDIVTILFVPTGYPPQRLVIPLDDFNDEELSKQMALRIKELRNHKPISMIVKVPLEPAEDLES